MPEEVTFLHIGWDGAGNASDSMQVKEFLLFFVHFKKQARPTFVEKELLLLDNNVSHVSIQEFHYCNLNGIVLLSFPPLCTHKLQTLDRVTFKSIKEAFPLSVTDRNALTWFSCTGISPFRNIFTSFDFAPSKKQLIFQNQGQATKLIIII